MESLLEITRKKFTENYCFRPDHELIEIINLALRFPLSEAVERVTYQYGLIDTGKGRHYIKNTLKLIFMQTELIQSEIEQLKSKLTGDMFQDMEVKDEIHNLEMKLNGVKPMDSHYSCVGCGS